MPLSPIALSRARNLVSPLNLLSISSRVAKRTARGSVTYSSFSEEVRAGTADPEEVVETDEELAAVVTRSGRQIRNKRFDDYVYY
ncbi:hypothetical protein EB796_017329 [Bugula neritina]|uniref:Uncharacterized protein n=1 Tax=Bugula neritina TaxID=10212 RepID=A0A7J7JDK7_BUGNE|nr:hypothetical protein EB796_017329 [Bugula neritina]